MGWFQGLSRRARGVCNGRLCTRSYTKPVGAPAGWARLMPVTNMSLFHTGVGATGQIAFGGRSEHAAMCRLRRRAAVVLSVAGVRVQSCSALLSRMS